MYNGRDNQCSRYTYTFSPEGYSRLACISKRKFTDGLQVFGVSKHAPIAAAVMIAFSAGGAVIALTYANALGKSQTVRPINVLSIED